MGSSSAGASEGSRPSSVPKPKKSILDLSPTVRVAKFVFNKVKGVFEKNTEQNRRNKLTSEFKSEEGPIRVATTYQSDNDNRPVATNVGGTIVKVPSPTTSEISQSNATDVTYDERKTKSKGRSMTILTSAKGVRKDNELILGKKSLLGSA